MAKQRGGEADRRALAYLAAKITTDEEMDDGLA